MDTTEQSVVNRRLGRSERFFWLLDQASPMSFSLYTLLQGGLNIDDLQRAMQRLQQEQPMLRVRVSVEAKHAYFRAVNDSPIEVQQIMDDGEHWREQILQQLAVPFAADEYPLIRCFYKTMQDQCLVFFICHHAISDGMSITRLMQRLLRMASNPQLLNTPLEYQPSHRALDQLLPLSYQGLRGSFRALLNRSSEIRDWYRHGKPQHVTAFKRRSSGVSRPGCVLFKLTEADTTALLVCCKQKGVSLQSVLIAAQLYAQNSFDNKVDWASMAVSSAVDVRAQLIENVSDDEVGLYMSFVLTALKFKRDDDFWQVVEQANSQLKLHISRDLALGFWHNLPPYFLFGATLKGANRLLSIANALSPASCIISNLGRLEFPGLNGLKVLESSFNLCPSILTSFCTAVTTVNGELTIGLNFDQQKMKEENVAVISESMRILLVTAVDR